MKTLKNKTTGKITVINDDVYKSLLTKGALNNHELITESKAKDKSTQENESETIIKPKNKKENDL